MNSRNYDVSIAVTRCNGYDSSELNASIQRHFQLLGGLGKFICRGDSVLLKPNFIAPKPRQNATQTDPAVIIETARLLKDFGAKPFVGDSPAWGDVFASAKALDMDKSLKDIDVPLKPLDKPVKCYIESIDTTVSISSVALEADKIINIPKLKTHQQLVATFAVKNIFGCVTGKRKAFWHFAKGSSRIEFCKLLIGIYKTLNPVFTLIDGIVAMESMGPINGKPRKLGFLISGTEPVACEHICCELVNFNPDDLPMLQTARQIGFGTAEREKIEVLGDDYLNFICKDFEPAQQIPLRFSLPRVIKSVFKQIIRKIKQRVERI